jgi:3-hydroxybutyryl-CoA dehydrogenase
MGAGIAQLACLGEHETKLWDPSSEALERGCKRLRRDLARGAERERWSHADAEAAVARLQPARELAELAECEIVIEAAPEDLELKRDLFAQLEQVCDREAVLATNTSSIPVAEIAAAAARPELICGMHFFNPPALMRLVEVVASPATSEPALAAITELAAEMGRTAIRCTDSPGFIVNRCNRPYSLESLRMLEAGVATHSQIDAVMREDGGYPMGPFELMDLIGIDVNLEVARSFYRQRAEARWKPSPISERMVAAGRLGRKSERGFYEYVDGKRVDAGVDSLDAKRRQEILERVVAQLVNEACFAVEEGVAEAADVDTAMKLGLNHPRGPFEWAERLGPKRITEILDALDDGADRRYRPAGRLRRLASSADHG